MPEHSPGKPKWLREAECPRYCWVEVISIQGPKGSFTEVLSWLGTQKWIPKLLPNYPSCNPPRTQAGKFSEGWGDQKAAEVETRWTRVDIVIRIMTGTMDIGSRWQHGIPTDQIEKAEVSRVPRSPLGPEALLLPCGLLMKDDV